MMQWEEGERELKNQSRKVGERSGYIPQMFITHYHHIQGATVGTMDTAVNARDKNLCPQGGIVVKVWMWKVKQKEREGSESFFPDWISNTRVNYEYYHCFPTRTVLIFVSPVPRMLRGIQ